MEPDISVLQDNRRKLAEMVTAVVEQTADVIDREQQELKRLFPAMAHQTMPTRLDPSVIRDFSESQEYREAVEAYIAGRLEVNLLVKALELLEKIAPLEFLRR